MNRGRPTRTPAGPYQKRWPVRFYHRTSADSAKAIMAGGFRDHEGTYFTGVLHRGVWLSDRPLDCNEGAKGPVLLSVEIPEELLTEYEWVTDGWTYREFLCPAELVNRHRPFTLVDEDEEPFLFDWCDDEPK
jgi:hypothetical protein